MDDPGTEALRQLAPQWSLAGDEQLLTILQSTHQKLLSKCQETNLQVEQMAAALNDASVRLQNVNNQFMALSSSQFIESRVYDDDEVVSTEAAVKESPQPSPADELSSLKLGLGVLDAAHESITILHDSDTDSDSEDDLTNRLVLKPRDLYADRPLPYIIGSQQWQSKWHAGLVVEDSDSDSSTSKVEQDSEQYSQSEQEDSPAGRRQVADTHTTISEASSELPSEPGSLPKASPADVAAEIARRLGGKEPPKVDQEAAYEEQVKPTSRKVYRPQDPVVSTVFPESPPPLSRADSAASDIFAELHRPPYSQPQDNDLFNFHDDGDIFSDFAKTSTEPGKPTSLFEAGPTPNMFKNTQPEVTVNQNTETQAERGVKKPIGGISLFGKKDTESIGAAILKRNQLKSSSSGDESGSDVTKEPTQPKEQIKTEKDIFDDLFARSEPKKVVKDKVNIVRDIQKEIVKKNEAKKEKDKSVAKEKVDLFSDNLFDDIDDIFSTNVVKMPTNSNTKSIFDDDDDLFSEIAAPKVVKNEATSSNDKRESIFDSEDELFSENVIKTIEKPVKDEKPNINENAKVIESAKSIFEDYEDIFSTEKVTNKLKDTKINTIQETPMFNEGTEIKPDIVTSLKSPSLFGDDDDDGIFSNTKHTNDDKTLNDENDKSKRNDEIVNNIEYKSNDLDNNVKINNNVIKDTKAIVEDTIFDVEEYVGSDKNLTKRALVGMPFEISNLLNKVIEQSSSDTNDDLSDQDFDDLPTLPKNSDLKITKTVENINKQSISDNDLDIDMFKERNKVENVGKDKNTFKEIKGNLEKDESNSKGEKENKDSFKDIKEHLDKVEDIFKDKKKYSSTGPNEPKDTFKEIKDNTEKDKDLFKEIKEIVLKEHSDKVEDFFKDKKNNSFTEPDKPKDTFKEIKENTDKDLFKGIKESISTEPVIEEPVILEKTKQDNNKNNEIVSTNITANIFTDIISEPPVFEKPKEPKKSKNVNALFDDDSDDESLFFKKDDVVSDEKPPDFKPVQDRLFGIFADEPPDDEFKANADFDDDLFSTLPKPKIPQTEHLTRTAVVESATTTIPTNSLEQDEDILTNLPKPESTAENLKLPISTTQKSEDNVSIYEKLHSKILESLDSDILDANDLFSKEFKPIQNKNIDNSGDDNLFASFKESLSSKTESPLDNIIKDTNDIFPDTYKAEIVKKDIQSEENLFKIPKDLISNLKQSKSDENTDLTERSETKKVGKLKLGLNINVNALLPGASPKKAKIKDQTDGQTQSQAKNLDNNLDKKEKQESDLPKSISFDGNPDSEVLDNKLSKERPRIQVKRRPSTRRARKEAVRKSGIDFGEDSTDNSSSIDDPPKHIKTQTEIGNSVNLDQTDGEVQKHSDQFDDLDKTSRQTEIHAEIQPENTEQDEIIKPTFSRNVKSKVVYILNDEDIFNSPVEKIDAIEKSQNLDSIVDSNPGVSTLGQVYKNDDNTEAKSSLFNDEDDDAIFKGKDVKKQTIFDSDSDEELFGNKKEKVKVKEVRKDIKVTGSLFGDEDDDDDLFGVKTKKNVETKPQPPRSTVKEASKSSAPVFEDPLSVFGDDD